jgi:hypothetical protein
MSGKDLLILLRYDALQRHRLPKKADLQSVGFNHSPTCPILKSLGDPSNDNPLVKEDKTGAGRRDSKLQIH